MKREEEQQRIPLLLAKELAGSLTDEERKTIEAWRDSHPHNAAVYARLHTPQRLDTELRRHRLTDYQRPLAEMKHRLGIGTQQRRTTYWAAAAAVLLLAGSTLLYTLLRQDTPTPTETFVAQSDIRPGTTQAVLRLAGGKTLTLGADTQQNQRLIAQATASTTSEVNDLSTPRGGEFRVVLEDGTEVWLNAATHLRYPETFEAGERRVEVSGEAYFKVAHDAERPFYVVSGGQQVRVYGTEFNVHCYDDEPAAYTTLVRGSISLTPVGTGGGELMLTPGKQAVFTTGDATATVRSVDTDVVTSWRSGTFVFENLNLEQIMHTLSRWYDFDYEFADATLAKTEFMGSIPKYSSFDEVRDIFHKIGGIHLRQEGRHIIISAR